MAGYIILADIEFEIRNNTLDQLQGMSAKMAVNWETYCDFLAYELACFSSVGFNIIKILAEYIIL